MDFGSILDEGPATPQAFSQLPASPASAADLLTPSAAPAPVKPPVTYRKFGDALATRKAIYDSVLKATQEFEPASNNQYSLALQNVGYEGRDNFTRAEQKRALLTGGTLGRAMRGDWVLTDPTGTEVARRRALVAKVPHLTERGTYIVNGSEYSVGNQLRLRPGIYTRQQANSELESHVNVARGRAHKIFLDPETGIFRIKIGQARIPLVPLLKTMGVTDKQLRENWGDLAAVNLQKSDPQALKKLYQKVKEYGTDTEPESQAKAVAEAFQKMELDPEVTQSTLGEAFDRVGPASILATTRKLLRVSRGEEEPDDRDAMSYQKLMGPEDLFAERVKKSKNIARNLLWKATARRNIDHIPAGALTNALQHTLTMSGLGQALEEINPAEILDHQSRVTRRGEGGIQDTSAIPMESRAVQPSQLGLIDYLRTPESLSAGVDVRLARNTMKGDDGRLYTKVLNAKTGELETKSAQDMNKSTLAFAGEMQSNKPYVSVLQNSRIRTVPREDVDFELPDTESSFSPIGNMIPFKSSVKGQRSVMGSRFLTQALPLHNAEAPLVQSGIPGQTDRSFEQEYGTYMGALRSPQGGVVTKVSPGEIQVRYDDGTKETHEMYQNFPFNRKSALHQTPTVQQGQVFKPGALLARSNFTDHEGTTALGMNARVAYLPDDGYNYEDAISISESFAKRMKSEHIYQHQHEWEEGDHQGKNAFISMFPSEYKREQLDNFDKSGVVKQGSVLRYGDPMILIASERERNRKSLTRSRTSFTNNSITWDHHTPGIVTDVVETPKGPAVVVKTFAEMNVADKLAGRVGDKGVIGRIIPDDQMPVAADGKPVEVLLNPLGLTSRTNPMQMLESALGKIAAKTGKPFRIPDFQNTEDLVEFALKELEKHGMEDTETITLHDGRKVPNVPVGNRWMMKLHHMADDKVQGRGLGSYSSEGTPAKGSQDGGKSKKVGLLEQNALLSHGACFMGSVNVLTENGHMEISQIVSKRLPVRVACMDTATRQIVYRSVVDWFCKCVPVEELVKLEIVAAANSQVKASHKTIRCTRGHEIYLADGGKSHAGNLAPGDTVLTMGTYLTTWQQQMLDGMLLGDASIGVLPNGKASSLSVVHGHTQRSYLDWKYAMLLNVASKPPKAGKLHPNGFAKVPTSRFTLRRHHEIMLKHVEFYTQLSQDKIISGVKRQLKTVPAGIVSRMGWLGIGVWFGDDGGCVVINKTGYITAVRFHTNAFSREEVQRLADEMREFTGLPWRVHLQNGKYPILTLGNGDGTQNNKGTDNVKQFLDMLQPYLPPMLGHKIRRDNCGDAWGGLDVPQGSWAEPAVVKVQQPYTPAAWENCLVYNITVEEHHNYIVHGVVVGNSAVITEDMRVKGQSSPEYWARYMSGYKPETPKVPFVYKKFVNQLRASGMNVVRQGEQQHIMAMTNQSVNELVGDRELKNAETVNWKNMDGIRGGLFDQTLTGGHGGTMGGGNKWSYIKLHTPLPNPVMEEPIRQILGLTQNKLQAIMGGKEQLNGKTGPQAIGAALASINLTRALENARADIASGKTTKRDKAVRKLGYLKTCERLGTHPKDWMLDKVPVLPPAFRPVSVMGPKKLPLVDDPNYLYKDLFQLNQIYGDLAKDLDPADLGDEQAAVYNAFKAVTGLGDPVGTKNQERGVKGILKTVFGSSPKYGVMNRKLLSSTVDTVGRGVIIPDPNLTLDEAGIPEEAAWEIYGPAMVRRLVRAGVHKQKAVQSVKDKLPIAREQLLKEMDEGVMVLSRAPTLHRYGAMAFRPKLVTGSAIKLNVLVNKGLGADYDGDQMNFRALTTDEAKQEAVRKMLPSVNLFSTSTFKADMNLPSQEYVAGLYQASKNRDTVLPPAVFATTADAVRAFRTGKLGFDRRVQIMES